MRASASAMSRTCLATFACAALTIATGFPGQAQVETFRPVTDAVLQDPDAADWLMWRRTLDSWGYSPLDQVDRDNVDALRMVWSRVRHGAVWWSGRTQRSRTATSSCGTTKRSSGCRWTKTITDTTGLPATATTDIID